MPNSLFMFSYNFPATLVRFCPLFCPVLSAILPGFFFGLGLFFSVFPFPLWTFFSRNSKKFFKFFRIPIREAQKNFSNFFRLLLRKKGPSSQKVNRKTKKKRADPSTKKKAVQKASNPVQNGVQSRTNSAGD